MNLLDLYKSMLHTANCTVTSDWLVSSRLVGQVMPVTIKGRRLALPAPEILARQDKSDILIFHPLMEQVGRGESEMVEKYRKLLLMNLNNVAATLMTDLLLLSGDIDAHKDLSPDQAEFLTKVKGVDDKLLVLWSKVLEAMPHDQMARRIVTVFLKKTGSVAGKRVKRVGVVSFPLYEELKKPPTVIIEPPAKKGDKETKKNEYDIYGVKCRAKDRDVFLATLEYLFPKIEEVGSYNRGSDSDVAVNMDALMQATLGVVRALNDVTETFGERFGKQEGDVDLYLDCDWQEAFVNIDSMWNEIRKIPVQEGNEGSIAPEQGAASTGPSGLPNVYAPQVQPTPVHHGGLHVPQQQPTPSQHQQPVQPSQTTTANPSLDAFLASREAERNQQRQFEQGWRAVTHQPPPGTVVQQPQMAPPPFIPNPAYNPAMQPPQMQPVHTGRGLDFGSVLASNPSVLYATGGAPGMYPQQQQQQPQTSRYFAQWQQGGMQPMYPQQQQPMYPQQQGYYQQQQGYQRGI